MMKRLFALCLTVVMVILLPACKTECEHKEIIDPAVAATCQKEGVTEGSHCSLCGEILKKQEIIPVGDHSFENGNKCACGLSYEDTKITVLSQNISCGNDGPGNNIVDRAPRFEKLVQKYSPDLMGTQEVTPVWIDYFKSHFGKEYGMVGCSWEGKDSTTGEWGLILYRKDRFELIDNGDFWLTSTPDVVSKIRGSECVRICTWAMLRDKVTDKTFVIANTHLDHKINTVRTKQAGYLLDGIKDFIEQYPVFLTGDFNAVPGSQAYLKLTETFYDARTTALEGTEDTSCTYDNYGLEGTGYIYDYCMCDDGAKALFYKVVNESFDGYVSDHYGVLAQFIIN